MTDGPGPVTPHRLADGRHLDVATGGTGAPVVVFEAGMGAGLASWATVAPLVAADTRVVTYSRAGYGASDPDPRPLDLARAVGDLTELMDGLDVDRAVLVGHSYGGPIVRQFCADHPDRAAGLLLVDPTDEGCDMFFARDTKRSEAMFRFFAPALAATGLSRTMAKKLATAAPADVQARVAAESGSRGAVRTFAGELSTYTADLERLKDHPLPRVEVPLTVLSAGKIERGNKGAGRRACVRAAHRARAEAAVDGRFVIAEGSSHLVPFEDPQLVADEIRSLLARCQPG